MIDLLAREEYKLCMEYAEELNDFSHSVKEINERYKMDSINQVTIEGFVGSEPYGYDFDDGNSVCHLSLGLVKYFKGPEDSIERHISFVPVDIYNPEIAFCKGDELRVTGSLKMDTWEKDGFTHNKLKVRARKVNFR